MKNPAEPPSTNGYEDVKITKRVDSLEIESLPRGEFTRLFIELIENGLGRRVQVPVVVARGKKDGPIFGITAALHGNELNGIPVIHQILQRVNLKTLSGTIVCVIVANMPGFLAEQREFNDGIDLNHIMPGKPYGKSSHVYAYELIDRITSHFDYLVDLHTASQGRVNSLYVRANLKEEMTSKMACLLRPKIIVHNPASDYTLRGVAAEHGKPAITVEICDPQKFQKDPIKRTIQGVRRIMSHIGMVPGKQVELPASSDSLQKIILGFDRSRWAVKRPPQGYESSEKGRGHRNAEQHLRRRDSDLRGTGRRNRHRSQCKSRLPNWVANPAPWRFNERRRASGRQQNFR